MASTPVTRQDFIGFAELAKARKQMTQKMFIGTKLKFGRAGAIK